MQKTDPSLPWSRPFTVADLPGKKAAPFSLTPNAEIRQQIADALGLQSVRKIRFEGSLKPVGKSDWHLSATLGATAVQSCVVTLQPVTTRIDEQIERSYMHPETNPEAGSELEMPQDDTVEPITDVIDPGAVMVEALALALPQFPRAPGAELENANFTAPGKAAMTDADTRPFAHLKSLRDGLKNDSE